jgi:hypothetical protein
MQGLGSILPIALAVAALGAPRPATAQQAVDDARLDSVRGGFDLGGGMFAAFGISRAVYVNGALVAQTAVQVPDVARITAVQAGALTTANAARVIQIGLGNHVDPAVLLHMGGTVIQNTLDNQRVKSLTTIDVTVSGLDTFRSLNLQDSLQPALLGSRGQ